MHLQVLYTLDSTFIALPEEDGSAWLVVIGVDFVLLEEARVAAGKCGPITVSVVDGLTYEFCAGSATGCTAWTAWSPC